MFLITKTLLKNLALEDFKCFLSKTAYGFEKKTEVDADFSKKATHKIMS